ncbi:hypothetical protein [Streptosporangium subroseum]|uniref:hypothetical protein n=1 Tax=Streptosporangium subroseum TaxID=106412 RepID=UPI00308B750F|nr:hypothetical protein OHB15_43705 [Streptosporangium subroseum]
MQRLTLFDLDNTLVDRLDAFRRWTAEFAAERDLSDEDAAWLITLDDDGSVPTPKVSRPLSALRGSREFDSAQHRTALAVHGSSP